MLKEKDIQDRNVLVLCPGPFLSQYKDKVLNFIKKKDALTIGCNQMSHIIVPDYHMFSDAIVYREQGGCLTKPSVPVFLNKLNKSAEYMFSENLIKRHWDSTYLFCRIKRRESSKNSSIRYENGIIRAWWKGTGGLAIVFAHAHEAKAIYVAGMDGYTFYSKEDLVSGKASQHCYGAGFTDATKGKKEKKISPDKCNEEYKKAVALDKIKAEGLHYVYKGGAKFKIITPTVYKEYYDGSLLGFN